MFKKALIFFCIVALTTSCLTYYQRTSKFNKNFEQGDFKEAESILSKEEEPKERNKLLHYLNMGTVQFMLQNHEKSNEYFEKAYRTAEVFREENWKKAVSLFTNPSVKKYGGEDHEVLLINYYKALNYLYLGDKDAALVECRRMNIQLNEINDKYKRDNRYKRDAFINLLMGLIYDANNDYNNAFIAYRNAFEIYKEDYQKLFGTPVPKQLKEDLLRTAYLSGFDTELDYYERMFDMNYKHQSNKNKGNLVFLWHNGMGPVKDQFSVTFTKVEGSGGAVTFTNEKYGWNFPFPDYNKENKEGLARLEIIRVALPKYVERPSYYQSADLKVDKNSYNLEMAENINKIAFQSLKDRILRELGSALLRVATKKAAELALREENEDLGAALGILNALTEQADTRNWQTLPHSIYYTRVPVDTGKQEVKLTAKSYEGNKKEFTFTYHIRPGETVFDNFHTLAMQPEQYYVEQRWED